MTRPSLPAVVRTTMPGRELYCPQCPSEFLHVTSVRIAAHDEGRPHTDIVVDNRRGAIATAPLADAAESTVPVGELEGFGNRDRVALRFYCEQCGESSDLVFTQHKGVTLTEWVRAPREPMLDPIIPM